MTQEQSTILKPFIDAYSEGKTIQIYHSEVKQWSDLSELSLQIVQNILERKEDYRVKPEPKFRPFKDRNECWEVMLYHKPFGWVLDKGHNERFNINSIGGTGVGGYTYRVAFEELSFADGTPFGVEE